MRATISPTLTRCSTRPLTPAKPKEGVASPLPRKRGEGRRIQRMTSSSVRLDGRVALVTGASGWIGAGIARHLAAAGAKVVVHYHGNAEKAQQVVSDIQKEG